MARRRRRLRSRIRASVRRLLAFLFSNVGVVVLVMGYTIAGAFIFQAIEGASEIERINHMARERDNTANYLWQNITLALNIFNETELKYRIGKELQIYQRKIVVAVRHGWDGGRSSRQWSFSSAFLYSLTVITTIGYGNLSPRTTWGKLATILYALLGLPLFLLYLSNIGELLARWFKCIYALVCLCRGCPGFTRRRVIRIPAQDEEFVEAESIERPHAWKSDSESSHVVRHIHDPHEYYPPDRGENIYCQRNSNRYARSYSTPNPPKHISYYDSRRQEGSWEIPPYAGTRRSNPYHIQPRYPDRLYPREYYDPRRSGIRQNETSRMDVRGQYDLRRMDPRELYELRRMDPRELYELRRMDPRELYEQRRLDPRVYRGYSEPVYRVEESVVSSDFTYVTFDAQTITVPISVCVSILVGYLIFGSMIFGLWEKWDQLDGAYFCFISLSSIGFGDIVPGDRVVTQKIETSFIVCSLYLMLGMALVAMCFNLMQEQVIHYVAGMKRALKRICRCRCKR